MNKLALFDCDGTLVDSGANICLAMERGFAAHGRVAPDRAAIRRIVGLSLVEAMAALLPYDDPETHEALAAAYKASFRDLRVEQRIEEPLFPGIAEVLDQLEAEGWLLGVATGKSDRGLDLCLAAHGLRDRFVTLQTADRHPSKPHPSMAELAMAEAGAAPATTVVIGDTRFDIGMAKAAGAAAVGVAWGYHEAAELRADGADAVAEEPAALPALLRGLVH